LPTCATGAAQHTRGIRGFTLIEIMITLGLLMIVLALLFYPITSSLDFFRTATARADAQTVARTALDAVAGELAEAMYVQLDMYDDNTIAFIPPLRLNPDDPNSEIVTPPRPDWSRAIRYWQALNDPTRNYNPGAYLEPSNLFFLARTVVPNPFTIDASIDPWNRWNDNWAKNQPTINVPGFVPGVSTWAPIPRAVNMDIDVRLVNNAWVVATRNRTLQPGYPYTALMYNSSGKGLTTDQIRQYRSLVVAMTPNAPEYDVPQMSFNPTAVSGERLRPIDDASGPNGCVYRSRYPLWRQGTTYTGWSALASNPQVINTMKGLGMDQWARDPFLLIAHYVPGQPGSPGYYLMQALGAFDPRTRTMKVVDLVRGGFYDTITLPENRGSPAAIYASAGVNQPSRFGFSVDWVDGSLRFDFPATRVVYPSGTLTPPPTLPQALPTTLVLDSTSTYYTAPLDAYWAKYTPGNDLLALVVPDSVTVRRVEYVKNPPTTGPTQMRTISTLRQVDCAPRDGRDEFELGTDPNPNTSISLAVPYGQIRLPKTLASADSTGKVTTVDAIFIIDFRWRNNSVMTKYTTATLASMVEKPDIIAAYYRTDAIVDVSLSVSRADPSAPVGKRIAQSVFLTRKVKLHNLLREIRYADNP
jgi:type II secretory pathway pseudopilin PulG